MGKNGNGDEWVVCPTCGGKAWDADGTPCPTCNGNGEIKK